jgi:KipI family sensor histidine kinase inhibitor
VDGLRISALSDRALLVTLSDEISEPTNRSVLTACDLLEAAQIPGVEEAQPAYSSFCVHFDPAKVSAAWLAAYAESIVLGPARTGAQKKGTVSDLSTGRDPKNPETAGTGREVEIPVVYGGDEGPDLAWASEYLGMGPEEIVRRHAASRYRVYMIGFSPGFPYLGGLDKSLAMPRTPTPRTSVPSGSVAIGGSQAGIYPWESPGGWRIIGRTPLKLFDPSRENPSLLRPGDTVRFVTVDGPFGSSGACEAPEATPRGRGPRGHWPQGQPECRGESARPGVPVLVVEHPGFLSLVVDRGRRGYRKLGVPLSGAADVNSYLLANHLCGNGPSEPALEMTLWGARIRALIDTVVAITGAPCPVTLDGEPVSMNEPVLVPKGSVLEIGSPTSGCRMYLAVSGGINVPHVLGSASTYIRGSFGGYRGRQLQKGDVLETGPGPWPEGRRSSVAPENLSGWPDTLRRLLDDEAPSIRVIPGPESSSQGGTSHFESLCGRVFGMRSDSDRMGIRLEGHLPQGDGEAGDILSSPVVPGVIQLPSDGAPVLLLHDAQTSGGYRRIAAVVSGDLPLAGQLRPGSKVRFIPDGGSTRGVPSTG